jgi:hypothetical protein
LANAVEPAQLVGLTNALTQAARGYV